MAVWDRRSDWCARDRDLGQRGETVSPQLDDLKAGLAYIGGNQTIKILFIFFAFVFFLVTTIAFLTPLLVTRSFGDEIWKLTANEVTFFAGSILGGIIMTVWGGFKNHFRTIGLSCILWAVLFTMLGLSKVFGVYLFFMFLAGIPMPIWNASTTTLLQEMVKPDMQGRVFGVQQLIMNTVLPVGMVIFGPIADKNHDRSPACFNQRLDGNPRFVDLPKKEARHFATQPGKFLILEEKINKYQGILKYAGSKNKNYLHRKSKPKFDDIEINHGDKVVFRWDTELLLENKQHRFFEDEDFRYCQRCDVAGILNN